MVQLLPREISLLDLLLSNPLFLCSLLVSTVARRVLGIEGCAMLRPWVCGGRWPNLSRPVRPFALPSGGPP